MKIFRIVFYIILNILISAGTIWLMFSFLNPGMIDQDIQLDAATGFGQSDNNEEDIATVIPDKLIIESVISAGNLEYERVTINHNSTEKFSLSGWQLVDVDGEAFTFPPIDLYPGGSLTIYSKAGNDTVTELYWGMGNSIWEAGEIVYLTDPAGYPQAMYVIP